jgi:flavin-dependent dehydrogenase
VLDALVAGAGPAGATVALLLARAGLRVRVVDRARFPRAKLCGDSVNPGALAVLRRLGLERVVDGALPIDGMIVTAGAGVRVEGRYGAAQGRSISRRDLDVRLLQAAAEAGAEVEEGVLVDGPIVSGTGTSPEVTGVMIRTGGRTMRMLARIVIGADGRYSRLARPLGLLRTAAPQRWAVGAYFEQVTGLSSCGEMHVREGHYIGVAPVPGLLANACVVTADRGALRNPSALLDLALRRDPLLAPRFGRARLVAPPVCLGPLAAESTAAGVCGLLLAGDAAGFIDPMTGDGLHFAFRGAELAAAAAVHALATGAADAHLQLAAARRREFAAKWRFNRTLRALVASPRTVRAAAMGAAVAPGVLRHVIAYAGDLQAA